MAIKLKYSGLQKHLLILILILSFKKVEAQVQFQQADSTSYALFLKADWKQLIGYGNKAIAQGIDFPYLRLRLGYASFSTGNFKAAIKEYDAVLKNDSYNQTARYYAYLGNRYLNYDLQASYHAAFLDAQQQKNENLGRFGLINVGLEAGLKHPEDPNRSDASFTRVFLSNRLGWKVQLEQSVAFYGQSVDNKKDNDNDDRNNATDNTDQQLEYYAKLSYAVSENTAILGAYHYLNTDLESSNYNSNMGFLGIKHVSTYFDVQGDINFGYMIDHGVIQYNVGFTYYPLGNLDLYTISRVSYLRQKGVGQNIFNQRLGFKLFKNLWSETSATFGNLDNYNEADGLYVYNLIDATKLKLGQTAFYQFNKNVQLQVNYTYEKKLDEQHNLTYNQHSVTAGISWKF